MHSNALIRTCTLTLPLFLAACGGELQPAPAGPSGGEGSELAQGTTPACKQFEPGCGEDPIPSAGCYVECSADADCGAGQACEARSINPCPADPNGGATCAACGMQVQLCVGATQQPPPTCTDYEPGCGSNPIPAAGCYAACSADADCASGEVCEERSINPCPADPNGGAVCDACGMGVKLCVAGQQQPPPPTCTDYLPGCGGNPIPAAGCYETCTTDVDCPSGKQCEQRSINPCPPNPNGGAVCLACGMEVGVCL